MQAVWHQRPSPEPQYQSLAFLQLQLWAPTKGLSETTLSQGGIHTVGSTHSPWPPWSLAVLKLLVPDLLRGLLTLWAPFGSSLQRVDRASPSLESSAFLPSWFTFFFPAFLVTGLSFIGFYGCLCLRDVTSVNSSIPLTSNIFSCSWTWEQSTVAPAKDHQKA